MTDETKVQYESAKMYGIHMEQAKETVALLDEKYDCIVDAILGISLNRTVEGIYCDILNKLNEMQAFKVAVDIPSGLHADTGLALGVAFVADLTAAFAFLKTGHLLCDAKKYCGEVVCFDIGITKESFLGEEPESFSYTKEDMERIPKRSTLSNKGSFGKLLLIAGSRDIGGAAILSALSAYRSGCGYVRVLTEEANRESLLNSLPEAVISIYKEDALDLETVQKACDFASVIVIGPGIGKSDTAKQLLKHVLKEEKKPCIIDADAINILSEELDYKELLKKRSSSFSVIMTPHLLELKRFLSMEIADIKKNLLFIGKQVAKEYNMVLVCKDATTTVFNSNGCYINQTGNDALATAGSGDVLAGLIGSMLAKGIKPMDAACISVFMHGACADLFAEKNGKSYMKAGDLIEQFRFFLE